MHKFNLLFVVVACSLLLATGCQVIVPTAQMLSQVGISASAPAPAESVTASTPMTDTALVEDASATITATETIEVSKDLTATTPLTDTAALTDTSLTESTAVTETAAMTETPAVTETAVTTDTAAPATPATDTVITDTATLTETAAITDAVAVTETAAPTSTAEMTDTVALTDTVAVTDTASVTTTTPATTTTETAVPAGDATTATILVASLRIRTGPSTDAEIVGGAVQGERYPIIGQALDCQWYQINHPVLGTVWIAGGEFAQADGDCAQIPAGDASAATALPTAVPAEAAPAATAAPAVETPSEPTIQPTPTPAEPVAQDQFPADQGCLLLQNQLGPELTFTFTSSDSGFSDTVKVDSAADVSYCLPPGSYRVTVDAPPPWADLNEEFTLNAGDRFFFPIRPR